GAQQLVRLRWPQRGPRLQERLMTAAAPVKPAREDDPRHPVHRLTALFDTDTVEFISPVDDSGMLAAVGQMHGTRAVAFCSDPTVMGGAMGDAGCRAVVDAYERALTEQIP